MNSLTIDGADLAFVDRGTGTPLVLIHGFPLDHSMWAQQTEGLASCCRVIAPDLRGFGRSRSTTRDVCVTMEQFADDVAALLDGLGIREPVALGGLSMGGYVAFQFWRKYPERLRGLILCDTRAEADSPEAVAVRLAAAERVLCEGIAPTIEPMLLRLFAETTRRERPEIVEQIRQSALGCDPAGVAAASRGMALRLDMSGSLAQIHCPTLVICGQSDPISPPAGMRAMAEAIPGARYVEVRGAHMAPLEDPEGVNGAIGRLVAGL